MRRTIYYLSAVAGLSVAALYCIPGAAAEPRTPAFPDRLILPRLDDGLDKPIPPGGRPAEKVEFPEIVDWNSLRITLDRGACMGTCPSYRVEIGGNGDIAFEGRRAFGPNTKALGKRTAHISKAEVEKLYRAFQAADFFWLADSYRARVTDGPTYRIGISFDGKTKQVTDYMGRRTEMPKVVTELEDAVDTAANTAQWIK